MPMTGMTNRIVLIADDDPDDCYLAQEAWECRGLAHELRFVHDGQELIDYLTHAGAYTNPTTAPRPSLVLLDLNMPRMDGREALRRIKVDESLRSVPVVVMTTSSAMADVSKAYDLGVNSYVTKPASFEDLVDLLEHLNDYWLDTVRLPETG